MTHTVWPVIWILRAVVNHNPVPFENYGLQFLQNSVHCHQDLYSIFPCNVLQKLVGKGYDHMNYTILAETTRSFATSIRSFAEYIRIFWKWTIDRMIVKKSWKHPLVMSCASFVQKMLFLNFDENENDRSVKTQNTWSYNFLKCFETFFKNLD